MKQERATHTPLQANDGGFHDVPGGPDDVSCVGGPTPGEHGIQRHSGSRVERPVPQVHHQLHVRQSHLWAEQGHTHMCVCVLLHRADNTTYTSASGTVICCIYCELVYTGPQIKLCSEPVELHYE